MSLAEMIAQDRDVFLNEDEFGSWHTIEGKRVRVMLDSDALAANSSAKALASSAIGFQAKTEDLPKRRAPGSTLNFDNKVYTIDLWSENMGMATVALSLPVSGAYR